MTDKWQQGGAVYLVDRRDLEAAQERAEHAEAQIAALRQELGGAHTVIAALVLHAVGTNVITVSGGELAQASERAVTVLAQNDGGIAVWVSEEADYGADDE